MKKKELIQYYCYVTDECEVVFSTEEPHDQKVIFEPTMLKEEMVQIREVLQFVADTVLANAFRMATGEGDEDESIDALVVPNRLDKKLN